MDVGCGEESGIYFWGRGEVGRAVDTAVHEVDAEGSVISRVVAEVADVCRRHEVHRAYQDPVRQARLHHSLHVPGQDHLVGPGVEVELGPARGCVEQPVIEVGVEEGGEWREQDVEQEGHEGEGHQEQQAQCGRPVLQDDCQRPQSPQQVAVTRTAVKDGAHHTQVTEAPVRLQELQHVPVQHDASVAEDVEEQGLLLNLVIKEQLKQLLGQDTK